MFAPRTTDTRWIIYLRLSDLRLDKMDEDGNGTSFAAREEKLREFASRLGGSIYKVIIENDVNRKTGKARPASAFKRKKVRLPNGRTELRVIRPGFREALDHFTAREANGLLTEDLDRTVRDPRDLEDLIDAAAICKLNARSLSGSLTFTDGGTDAEITQARIMVSIANKSSRDTSRRVASERERQALGGRWGGGPRPYGFESDGVTQLPYEAEVIRDSANRLLELHAQTGKHQLSSVAAELREKGVPTVDGRPWQTQTLRDILLRPRNAGLMVYRGQEVGKAPWEPIIPEDVFRAVVRLLGPDAERVGKRGAPQRGLGSGIYRCGVCDDGTTLLMTAPSYICRGAQYGGKSHLGRNVVALDEYVVTTLLERINTGGADQFLASSAMTPEVDTVALRAERATIRVELDGLAEDRALGLIDRSQMLKATQRAQARMQEIDRMLAVATVESPVSPLVNAAHAGEKVDAVWEAQPRSTQRAILDMVMQVTVHPTKVRNRFDVNAIHIVWKEPEGQ